MKLLQTILLSMILHNVAFAESKNIQINNTQFEIKTIISQENEQGFEQTEVQLFRDHKKLLSHIINQATGDCSILTTEVGDYEVKGNQLIFYTYWAAGDRQGLWTYPYGVRKQVYEVDSKGMVKPNSAMIYVEDVIGNPLEHDPEQEYLQFLKKPPQTAQQKKALQDYIQTMQQRYKARFVFGQEREQLLKEVKAKLAQKIEIATKGWKEDFGQNVRM